jgi:hypothetical protein
MKKDLTSALLNDLFHLFYYRPRVGWYLYRMDGKGVMMFMVL